MPKLPAFREQTDDIDSYLFCFEAHATALKWDKVHWVTYLSALLEGTTLTLFHSLYDTEDGTVTYEKLKSALLKKFQCTPEDFRKRFRESKPTAGEPFETYAVELRRLADRWIFLSKVEKTYQGLLGLILSEQLLQSVSLDLATFLCEKDERSFQNLIKSAESYRHAHTNKSLARRSEATVLGSVGSVRDEHRPVEHFCSTNSFRAYSGYQSGQSGPSRFWNRRGFDSTRRSRGGGLFRGQAAQRETVDTGRSVNQSSAPKACYLCNRVIFMVLVHENQGKIRVGFVLSVIPLISVPFIRWLRRNLGLVLWHPLLFVLKLLVPCRNLFRESCTFSLGR